VPNLQNNDVLLYTIRYQQAGQIFMNTQVFAYTDSLLGNDDYAVLSNAWLAAKEGALDLIPSLLDIMHPSGSIVDHRMQLISPQRLAPIISTVGDPGTAIGDALPTNVAGVATKRTINATRWGIGSWHQPCLASSAITSAGVVANSYRVALETALQTNLQGSYQPGGSFGSIRAILWGRAVPLRFSQIESYVGQATPRVMRRRTVGVGI
jgi:hypothetical protein